jgi:hypothetical protein
MRRRDAGNYVDKHCTILDSNIRNSVCTAAKLPCRRVGVGYEKCVIIVIICLPPIFKFVSPVFWKKSLPLRILFLAARHTLILGSLAVDVEKHTNFGCAAASQHETN